MVLIFILIVLLAEASNITVYLSPIVIKVIEVDEFSEAVVLSEVLSDESV